jgi:PAS domain S-box-containing protein
LAHQVDPNAAARPELSPTEVQTILGAEQRGLCVVDPQGTCRYVTPSFCRLLGYAQNEVVGAQVAGILKPLPLDALRPGALQDRELVLSRKDGSRFPARLNIQELSGSGAPTGSALFVEDLTEQKHMEEVLRKTEKLASAGRMAAAIAHEINNPLEAVTNLLYLLRSEMLNTRTERYLSLLESEVERVSRIARQTLAFYREKGKPERLDVRELLNIAVDVHSTRNPEVRVHRRYRTTAAISGFASELQQVFHNLIGNAIDAGAKDIYLHTRNCTENAPPRRKGLCVTVADNGAGIDPGIRGQLFHPFVTTKGDQGTGLGLWTSRGIVVRHEGMIKVRSSTRAGCSGTCFVIFLPR